MGELQGKTALVTGAGQGVGQGIALALAAEGVQVVVTGRTASKLDKTVAMIAGRGGSALALGCNVKRLADLEKSVNETVSHFGGLNILVNNAQEVPMGALLDVTDEANWIAALDATTAKFDGLHALVQSAGIAITASVTDTSLEDWRRVHAIDLDGVFLGCKYAVPTIADSGGGAIVNISSIAGVIAGHDMTAYNSAKAGVRHLSKSVALHCARQSLNIRCNSVHPTFIDTPILDDVAGTMDRQEVLSKLGRQVPMGRIGAPREVAYAILYLACEESSFTTGSELFVDGGIAAM